MRGRSEGRKVGSGVALFHTDDSEDMRGRSEWSVGRALRNGCGMWNAMGKGIPLAAATFPRGIRWLSCTASGAPARIRMGCSTDVYSLNRQGSTDVYEGDRSGCSEYFLTRRRTGSSRACESIDSLFVQDGGEHVASEVSCFCIRQLQRSSSSLRCVLRTRRWRVSRSLCLRGAWSVECRCATRGEKHGSSQER